MRNGETVAAFEREFAAFVGASYAIALCNGTATLHTALVALGVRPGDRVAVPPLTMSATTIAVLHAGAVPVFCDVDPDTWLMKVALGRVCMPVSLFGLHYPEEFVAVDDAAQTLRPHNKGAAFTSYSFQNSKILPLGEGGMLTTDSEELATKAREFSSLGYRMRPDQPRIDPAILKDPAYERHHSLGWNYRMNDITAAEGLKALALPDPLTTGQVSPNATWNLRVRSMCADLYRQAIAGCSWLTPQHVPEGWTHDYWTYAVALDSADLWHPLVDAIVKHGGERPFGAWRLTYQEPAFRHLAPKIQLTTTGQIDRDPMTGLGWEYSGCPIAESLQPRLLQMQTNVLQSAEKNATALAKAIGELGG